MLIDETTHNDVSYDMLVRRLAVESSVGADILGLFRSIVPKSQELITAFMPNLAQLADDSSKNPLKSSLFRSVLTSSRDFNFLAYEQTLIMVPEGFNGKLVTYLELLIAHTQDELREGVRVLNEYNLELSSFISNADVRKSLRSHGDFYKNIRQAREDWEKNLKKFFDEKNHTISRRPLGTVIERFADLERVFAQAEKLAELRSKLNYQLVKAEVDKTVSMLDLIRERLTDGNINDLSGQVAKNLSEGAYEVAKFVESISIHGYHIETAVSSVNSIAEQLKAIFNK